MECNNTANTNDNTNTANTNNTDTIILSTYIIGHLGKKFWIRKES